MVDPELRRPSLLAALGPVFVLLALIGFVFVVGAVVILIVIELIEGSPTIS